MPRYLPEDLFSVADLFKPGEPLLRHCSDIETDRILFVLTFSGEHATSPYLAPHPHAAPGNVSLNTPGLFEAPAQDLPKSNVEKFWKELWNCPDKLKNILLRTLSG